MRPAARKDISSLTLHLIAMGAMLCDHMWATVVPGNDWLTWIGRLAFPIFAFLLVEGYCHTRNFRRYLGRVVLVALLAELPFNLMYTASWIFPFHQNVLWSFALSLLCLRAIDELRQKQKPWLAWLLAVLVAVLCILTAQILMMDYYSFGVMTVLVFYLFRGRSWQMRVGQAAGLFVINWYLMGSMRVPIELLGFALEIPQQGVAVLALLPIWAYAGRQGPHSKPVQFFCYAFYPVHMLILGLLSM